ncbi:MAG: hypothetical protein PVF22_07680 [Candidatus Aminicenantes bacterium]|jgi:transaldolase/glucose-6-phosphate isomerase
MIRMIFNLQEFHDRVMGRLSRWQEEGFIGRLKSKDPTLWISGPQTEISDRLGWLALPDVMREKTDEFLSFREEVKSDSFSHVVLCGMGGSSLAPEVFQETFGNAPGYPRLLVLDSTHPSAILSVEKDIVPEETLFIVSSKSGTTLETLSLFRYFWEKISRTTEHPGRQFVAITDPETPLEALAERKVFRKIFLAPSDVGGRYSALSDFGLLPAALIGLDIKILLEKAKFALESCDTDVTDERASCLFLGASFGELYERRDKLTVFTSPSLKPFPNWIEQLVAESTGKEGRGIVPVVNEPLVPVEHYGNDRYFVALFLEPDLDKGLEAHMERVEQAGHPSIRIDLKEEYGLAQEIFRWEMAVASAGSILGIHPFNQPDVQLAKDLARKAMEKETDGSPQKMQSETFRIGEKRTNEAFSSWLSQRKPGDYIGLQVFLPQTAENERTVSKLRERLLDKTGLASTAGFGPRFLHSTGQLHKGGPNTGLFLQLVDDPVAPLPVPETAYTFNSLIQAQAFGDYQALKKKKRRVIRINLGDDAQEGFKRLEELI